MKKKHTCATLSWGMNSGLIAWKSMHCAVSSESQRGVENRDDAEEDVCVSSAVDIVG